MSSLDKSPWRMHSLDEVCHGLLTPLLFYDIQHFVLLPIGIINIILIIISICLFCVCVCL
jgi:hypothetical protein